MVPINMARLSIVALCLFSQMIPSAECQQSQELLLKEEKPDPSMITIYITADGKFTIDKKEYSKEAIIALFEERKAKPEFQEKSDPRFVTYSLLVRADELVEYQNIQWALQVAIIQGGITKVKMDFDVGKPDKTKEASTPQVVPVPRDKGPVEADPESKERWELRVKLRYDPKNKETSLFLEKNLIGKLSYPSDGVSNDTIWKELLGKFEKLSDPIREGKINVILDADGEVVWRHVADVAKTLKSKGIENIEFTGNSKLSSELQKK